MHKIALPTEILMSPASICPRTAKSFIHLAFIILSMGVSGIRTSEGHELLQHEARWPELRTSFFGGIPGRSSSGYRWSQAFEESVKQWSAGTAIAAENVAAYRDPCDFADGVNGAGFSETACGKGFGYAIAVTFYISEQDTNGIWVLRDTGIVFNSEQAFDVYDGPLRKDVMDFRRTALHELGHALGLGHETREPSIMSPSPSNIFTLQSDDMLAIRNLYFPIPVVRSIYTDSVQHDSVTLTAFVDFKDIETSVHFEYGLTPTYGFSSSPCTNTQVVGFHSVELTGLQCATAYHFRAVASNRNGTTYGEDRGFSTEACPLPPPSIETRAATHVTNRTATLNGVASANGSETYIYFEYAAADHYGRTDGWRSIDGNSSEQFSVDLYNLKCNSTYTFRAAASKPGVIVHGMEHTFTTTDDNCVGRPGILSHHPHAVDRTSATVSGTLDTAGSPAGIYIYYYADDEQHYRSGKTSLDAAMTPVSFQINLDDLQCGTRYTYYPVPIAENGFDERWGYPRHFETRACAHDPGVTLAGWPTPMEPGIPASPGGVHEGINPIFRWVAVAGATDYILIISDEETDTVVYQNNSVGNVTSFAIPDGILDLERYYSWTVRAHNLTGFSEISEKSYFWTASYDWPTLFNGVAPEEGYNVGDRPVNNIGHLVESRNAVYTCVNVYSLGVMAGSFDVILDVLSEEEGIVKVRHTRPFNVMNAVKENGARPDCSGQYSDHSGVYSDTVLVGRNYFRVHLQMIDSEQLKFQLIGSEQLLKW